MVEFRIIRSLPLKDSVYSYIKAMVGRKLVKMVGNKPPGLKHRLSKMRECSDFTVERLQLTCFECLSYL